MKDETVAIVNEIFDAETTDKPFGKRWANQLIRLKPEHLQALQQKKRLALDVQGEYVIYIQLDEESAHV